MFIAFTDYLIIFLYFFIIYYFTIKTTGYLIKYSIKNKLIDTPGERSSHSSPTPRGGGLSITITIIIAIFITALTCNISINTAMALCVGGFIVSIVGWIDDHKDIAAWWRGTVYLTAATIAIIYLGGLENININKSVIYFGITGSVLAVIGITWITNLYNFMDGADAIASIQAITAGGYTGIIFWINNQYGLAIICFTIITSCAGFLAWNWPPAKIFMGDVGSCMIGYTFGTLAVIGEITKTVYIYIWMILLAVFIWDATFTLLMRVINREKWYSAHRSHGYQRLIQMGMSHSTLAIYFLLFNIFILWPIAYIAYKYEELSLYMTAFSIILIFILWSIIQYKYRNKGLIIKKSENHNG